MNRYRNGLPGSRVSEVARIETDMRAVGTHCRQLAQDISALSWEA
jgi:hypothetical protein